MVGYFKDNKRGEIADLQRLLRNSQVNNTVVKRREAMQKVIAYMTSGYDVSSLFSDVVLSSATTDLISKKMCYLYLSDHAQHNEELTTLCVNTMTKDCRDPDPSIRGLAIRTLSSLQLATVSDYLLPIVQTALNDVSPYVRRNSVLAILKIFKIDRSRILPNNENEEAFPVIDTLYNMVGDSDKHVAISALYVLNEMLLDEGGIKVNKKMINYLIKRINNFDDWGKSTILRLIVQYNPHNEIEITEFMTLLDPLLYCSNTEVLLATIRCFLLFANTLPDIKLSVYTRLKKPLVIMYGVSEEELKFILLKHIYVIVLSFPGIFDNEYKQFYLWHNESWILKEAKLKILCELANNKNLYDIVGELNVYVVDAEEEVVRSCIKALSRVSVKVASSCEGIINQLLQLCNPTSSLLVWCESLSAILKILRKQEHLSPDVLRSLSRFVFQLIELSQEDLSEKDKENLLYNFKSILTILGLFGKKLSSAPKLLQHIIDTCLSYATEDVLREMFWTTLQLFMTNPTAVEQSFKELHGFVRERAFSLSPLLLDELDMIVGLIENNCLQKCLKLQPVSSYREDDILTSAVEILPNFNSLSIIYNAKENTFTHSSYLRHNYDSGLPVATEEQKEEQLLGLEPEPAQDYLLFEETETDDKIQETSEVGDLLGNPLVAHPSEQPKETFEQPINNEEKDVLDLFLDNLEIKETTKVPDQPQRVAQAITEWALVPSRTLDRATFDSNWNKNQTEDNLYLELQKLKNANLYNNILNALEEKKIYCLPEEPIFGIFKFKASAKDTEGVQYLASFEISNSTLMGSVRTTSDKIEKFSTCLTLALADFL